jgi:hypothetical protein
MKNGGVIPDQPPECLVCVGCDIPQSANIRRPRCLQRNFKTLESRFAIFKLYCLFTVSGRVGRAAMDDDKATVFEPPFYLLETETECWKCGKEQGVIALASKQTRDEPGYGAVTITYARCLPAELRFEVFRLHRRFGHNETKTTKGAYYVNFCECGALIGDHRLHKSGMAFFPDDHKGVAGIRVKKLEYNESFRTMADPSWGIAEEIIEAAKLEGRFMKTGG